MGAGSAPGWGLGGLDIVTAARLGLFGFAIVEVAVVAAEIWLRSVASLLVIAALRAHPFQHGLDIFQPAHVILHGDANSVLDPGRGVGLGHVAQLFANHGRQRADILLI